MLQLQFFPFAKSTDKSPNCQLPKQNLQSSITPHKRDLQSTYRMQLLQIKGKIQFEINRVQIRRADISCGRFSICDLCRSTLLETRDVEFSSSHEYWADKTTMHVPAILEIARPFLKQRVSELLT